MRRFRLIAVLLSLALATTLALSVSGAPPVEAGGDIESEFAMVDNPDFTPGDGFGAAGSGSGEFELDGDDLDDLEFELEVEAHGLMPNTWYDIRVTVRVGFTAGKAFPIASVVAGGAMTNDEGEFEAEGEGVIPNVFTAPGGEWRIDQQVVLPGSGTEENCVDCILVCAPTTKVVLNDDADGLVLFGVDDDDDDDDDEDEDGDDEDEDGDDD